MNNEITKALKVAAIGVLATILTERFFPENREKPPTDFETPSTKIPTKWRFKNIRGGNLTIGKIVAKSLFSHRAYKVGVSAAALAYIQMDFGIKLAALIKEAAYQTHYPHPLLGNEDTVVATMRSFKELTENITRERLLDIIIGNEKLTVPQRIALLKVYLKNLISLKNLKTEKGRVALILILFCLTFAYGTVPFSGFISALVEFITNGNLSQAVKEHILRLLRQRGYPVSEKQ